MRYICLVGLAVSSFYARRPFNESGRTISEFRTGLDHLEFLVASQNELQQWAKRLDELGIAHSGRFKELSYTQNAMITFRILTKSNFEFFWRALRIG